MTINRPEPTDVADLLRADKSAQILAWIDRAIDLAGDIIEADLERPLMAATTQAQIYLAPGDTTVFIRPAPMSGASITVTEQATGVIVLSQTNVSIPTRVYTLELVADTDCVVSISGTVDWPNQSAQKTADVWAYAAAVVARQYTEDLTGIAQLSREGISVSLHPLRQDPEYRSLIRSIQQELGRHRWQD